MSDKKPTVFPAKNSQQPTPDFNPEEFEQQKRMATNEIYDKSISELNESDGHANAVEMMRRRTEMQLQQKQQYGTVQDPSLSEVPKTRNDYEKMEIQKKAEEQMRLRDEALARNSAQTNNYQKQYQEVSTKREEPKKQPQIMQENNPQPQNFVRQQVQEPVNYGPLPSNIDPRIAELSQPDYNSPFDVIPLPSQGKIYKSKKSSIKVAYMNTLDESILTSPNLLNSGQFLEILLNRKILEPEIRYKDLDIGDRNAVMLWLRATSYGEMYPVVVLDEEGVPFETEVNLNELKFNNLKAEPDTEGYFDYVLPISKTRVKFRMLTCGDIDEIEKIVEREKENGAILDNTNTYVLQRRIVEVNGSRNKADIESIFPMRIGDSASLTKYISEIESGVDLNITLKTPRGGVITTFLPLTTKFFWPNFSV
jgi:hypothetical protein